MNMFYNFEIKRKKDEALLKSLLEYDDQQLRNAEFRPSEPFEMKISEGTKLFDIVGYQDTSNFAISKRVFDLLNINAITGWKSYEISIKGNRELYFGFQVTGKCSPLFSPKTRGFYTGYEFDFNSWDKSDFFSPNDTMLVFCTKKVQEIFEKNKVTNAELINLKDAQGYSFG